MPIIDDTIRAVVPRLVTELAAAAVRKPYVAAAIGFGLASYAISNMLGNSPAGRRWRDVQDTVGDKLHKFADEPAPEAKAEAPGSHLRVVTE